MIPKDFRGAPGSFRAILEGFRVAPNYLGVIPKSFRMAPKYFGVIPKCFRVVPNHFGAIPKGFRMIPKSFGAAPESFRVAPKDLRAASKLFKSARSYPAAPLPRLRSRAASREIISAVARSSSQAPWKIFGDCFPAPLQQELAELPGVQALVLLHLEMALGERKLLQMPQQFRGLPPLNDGMPCGPASTS